MKISMRNEMVNPNWDYEKWKADPTFATRTSYGDIYRLDAFPWIDYLDSRSEPVIEQRDEFDIPTRRVRRYWRVEGTNSLGRPSERGLYLELLLMLAEADWKSREIDFSVEAMALRLNLEPGPSSRKWISEALIRLRRLNVDFLGTTVEREVTRTVECSFCLISSLDIVDDEGIYYTISWSSEVFRALRTQVQARQASKPALSLEQIMSSFFAPIDPVQTRPG